MRKAPKAFKRRGGEAKRTAPHLRVVPEPAMLLVLRPDPPVFTIVAAGEEYRAMTGAPSPAGRGLFEALSDKFAAASAAGLDDLRTSLESVLRNRKADRMALRRWRVPRPASHGGGWEDRYCVPVNSPVLGPGGEIRYIVHRVEDVTELVALKRRVAEQERLARELQGRARELDRRKDEFLANMSHEIRSPMTSVLGNSDILLSHLTDPDDVECVKTIKQSGNYLLELIDDILDLSKIESDKLRIKKGPVLLPELLNEIHSLMSMRAREKKLPLALRFDGAIPERIETDRARLRQILINLLSNAIKFTENGGIQIVVRFLPERALLQAEVLDTGIGIPREQHDRIFQPFTQGDGSATRGYGGLGLGLAITRRLVEMMEGQITFESERDRGTSFRVTLPTGRVQAPLVGDIAEESPAAEALSEKRLDCRVLVADDRREIQYLVRHFIEDAGGRVAVAADGEAAVKAVKEAEERRQPFDVVIMDIQMPVIDGHEAARILRASGFDRPIIALTAGAMRDDREKCLEAGCDDYLTKPIDRRALVELVSYYARKSEKPPPAPGQRRQPVSAEGKAGRKILLVDDSEVACRSTGRLLEMSGHEVRLAFTGQAALSAVRDFDPDVVILDIKLPDMDGYELLARLKRVQRLQGVKFIALTGYDEEDRTRAPGAQFHHFIRKPVDAGSLEALFFAGTP